MKKELERINKELNRIFKGKNPMIQIFGDFSWSVDVDGVHGGEKCVICGEMSGDTIEELENFLKNN